MASNTSGVRSSSVAAQDLRSFLAETAVMTSASGDLQTCNGFGVEIFQSLTMRPCSAECSRDSESNCASTISGVSAASGLYNLITKLSCPRQTGCRSLDRTRYTVE